MKAVKVAELKAHLSEHLRAVKAGAVVTVFDRTTPVARLVPVDSPDDVTITVPPAGTPPIGRVPLPPRTKVKVDVVDLLLEDRRRRR